MARARNEENIEILLFDQSIHGNIGEDLAGVGSPVTEQPRFEMLDFKRIFKQRVVFEVEHAEAEIETGAHVVIGDFQFFVAEGLVLDRRAGFAKR